MTIWKRFERGVCLGRRGLEMTEAARSSVIRLQRTGRECAEWRALESRRP